MSFGDELGHTPFSRRQRIARRGSSGNSLQLSPCLLGPQAGTKLLEGGQGGLERSSGRTSLLAPSLQDAAC